MIHLSITNFNCYYIAPAIDLVDNTDLLFGGIFTNTILSDYYHVSEYTDADMLSTEDTSGQFNFDELLLCESYFSYRQNLGGMITGGLIRKRVLLVTHREERHLRLNKVDHLVMLIEITLTIFMPRLSDLLRNSTINLRACLCLANIFHKSHSFLTVQVTCVNNFIQFH